jgi:tetratricopeptide (TPR) repeat protein
MRWLWAVFLVLAFATSAAAQAQVDEAADAEAQARFAAGRAAMAAGRAEDALADFQRAYELSHRPALLYNMGVAADRLRRDEEALAAFEQYLEVMPPDAVINRAEVESRIEVLRRTIAERTAATVVAPDHGASVPGIALVVSGGAVAVAGAVLVGVGASERSRVENAPGGAAWAEYAGSAESAPILEGSGAAALGVGVALAATGAVLLAIEAPGERAVAVLPFGAGAQVVGRW